MLTPEALLAHVAKVEDPYKVGKAVTERIVAGAIRGTAIWFTTVWLFILAINHYFGSGEPGMEI